MVQRGLEALSRKDGAWYDVDCAKTKIMNTPEGPMVQVRFSNFDGDEDERFGVDELNDHFRRRARPVRDSQCSQLRIGGVVVAMAAFDLEDERKWQDAVITEIRRADHGPDECLCSYKLEWKIQDCPSYRVPNQLWHPISNLCFISKSGDHLSHPFIVKWREEVLKRLEPAKGVRPSIRERHWRHERKGRIVGGTEQENCSRSGNDFCPKIDGHGLCQNTRPRVECKTKVVAQGNSGLGDGRKPQKGVSDGNGANANGKVCTQECEGAPTIGKCHKGSRLNEEPGQSPAQHSSASGTNKSAETTGSASSPVDADAQFRSQLSREMGSDRNRAIPISGLESQCRQVGHGKSHRHVKSGVHFGAEKPGRECRLSTEQGTQKHMSRLSKSSGKSAQTSGHKGDGVDMQNVIDDISECMPRSTENCGTSAVSLKQDVRDPCLCGYTPNPPAVIADSRRLQGCMTACNNGSGGPTPTMRQEEQLCPAPEKMSHNQDSALQSGDNTNRPSLGCKHVLASQVPSQSSQQRDVALAKGSLYGRDVAIPQNTNSSPSNPTLDRVGGLLATPLHPEEPCLQSQGFHQGSGNIGNPEPLGHLDILSWLGEDIQEVLPMQVNDGRVNIDECKEISGFPCVTKSSERKTKIKKIGKRRRHPVGQCSGGLTAGQQNFLQTLRDEMKDKEDMSRIELLYMAASSILAPENVAIDKNVVQQSKRFKRV